MSRAEVLSEEFLL